MYKSIVPYNIKLINIYGNRVKMTMGRKRTSNKERILVSIDKDLLNLLKKYDINRSILFTQAAQEKLKDIKENSELSEK